MYYEGDSFLLTYQVAIKEIDRIRNIYKILQEQPQQQKKWFFPDDFIHTSMSIQLRNLTVDVREGGSRKLYLTGAMHDLELISLLRHTWYTVREELHTYLHRSFT